MSAPEAPAAAATLVSAAIPPVDGSHLAAPGDDWSTHPSANAAKTDLWYKSSRGEKLHVRTFLPEDASSIKAVVFFLHGYGGHVSYISKLWFGKYLSERGMAVVMPDLVGHGYSEVRLNTAAAPALAPGSRKCLSQA